MNDADSLRAAMIAGLVERGELDQMWRPSFEAVPRHWFIPDRVWRYDDDSEARGPDLVAVDRADDPDAWLRLCYDNEAVFTQVDDGRPAGERGAEVSSSASMPAIVAQMLTAAELAPGMRVLEIGTGTGWNTALLAHRLSMAAVISVEIDSELARTARRVLGAHGYGATTLIAADGLRGWPAAAPYDRVLATVAAHQVPYAWVEQTRPGGVILVPWGTTYYSGALLRIEVVDTDHGPVGHGRIVGNASFMLVRSQRTPRASIAAAQDKHPNAQVVTTTDVHPYFIGGDPHAATAIGLRLPGLEAYAPRPEVFHIIDRDTGSWASVHTDDGPPYRVEQAGPRRLHYEVAAAYERWRELGEPTTGDWRVTIEPDGQHVDLPCKSGGRARSCSSGPDVERGGKWI